METGKPLPVGFATPEQAFGWNVRALRTIRGWTQGVLAERMAALGHSVHQSTVAKLEAGTRPTDVGEVVALATIFGVPVQHLFTMWAEDDALQSKLSKLEQQSAAIAHERARVTERLAALDREQEALEALRAALADEVATRRHQVALDEAEAYEAMQQRNLLDNYYADEGE